MFKYYVVQLLALLLFLPMCIGGMRGGLTKAVRPITISNANQYVDRPEDAALVLNTPFSLIRTIGKRPDWMKSIHQSVSPLLIVWLRRRKTWW